MAGAGGLDAGSGTTAGGQRNLLSGKDIGAGQGDDRFSTADKSGPIGPYQIGVGRSILCLLLICAVRAVGQDG